MISAMLQALYPYKLRASSPLSTGMVFDINEDAGQGSIITSNETFLQGPRNSPFPNRCVSDLSSHEGSEREFEEG